MSDLDVVFKAQGLFANSGLGRHQAGKERNKHTLVFVSCLLLLIGESIENVYFPFANCHLLNYLT